MLPDRLTRALARVVLATYITHLVAPVALACEMLTHSPVDSFAKQKLVGKHFSPSLKENQRPISQLPKPPYSCELPLSYAPSTTYPIDEERARQQAEAYQYRLRVKNLDARKGQFQVKLSRKEKGTDGSFESLHTASIARRIIKATSSQKVEEQDDILLNLFQRAILNQEGTGGALALYLENNLSACKLGCEGGKGESVPRLRL